MSLSVSKFQQSTKPQNFSFFIKQSSQCKTINISQILDSFVTCPYISIRQLIVAFFIILPVKQPIQDSQSLLSKQFKLNPSLKHLDEMLFLHIHQYKQQKRKHEYLIYCFQHFMTEQKQVRKLKQQCESQLRAVTSMEHSELVENLQDQFAKLQNLNSKYLTAINKFTSIYHYSEYFMSALHEIIKYSNLRNIYPNKELEEYLNDLKESLKNIVQNIEQVQGEKIRIRHKVKFNEFMQADIANKRQNKVKQVQEIYYLLYKLSPSIKHSMNELTNTGKRIKQEYKKFLEIYTECVELQEAKNNTGIYSDIIRQQKDSLTQHLKNNHDLMVKYNRSVNYSDFLYFIKSKVHIYKMFGSQIEQIEHAIKFINEDYEPLFRQLCQNKNSSANGQLKREVDYFMNASQQGYNVIILNFLNKLQHI